jgi:hypothetical protein
MAETTGTNTILIVDDQPHLSTLELIRAMERMNAKVFDVLALPPSVLQEVERPSAERILREQAAALPGLFGIQVRVSKALEGLQWPARWHKKRRNQSEAYHRRVQKKWNKRFGTGPAALLINSGLLRGPVDRTDPTNG